MSSIIPSGQSPFDGIKHVDDSGEYWLARELGAMLGYRTNYRNFIAAIERAKKACEGSDNQVSDHFAQTRTMVPIGSNAEREVDDYRLTRYACYLTVQNADPTKTIVALAQTYFAITTRQQELAEIDDDDMTEDQRRLDYRNKARKLNRQLDNTVHTRGVVTGYDHAQFHDAGYEGLYAGENENAIHARKELDDDDEILDWMGSEELGANIFRITQTQGKIVREGITGKGNLNTTHRQIGRKVREAISDIGGTMPEELPTPVRDIPQVQRDETRRLTRGQDLFDLNALEAPKENGA